MKINSFNYEQNTVANPSFGKVVGFENGFQKYINKLNTDSFRYADTLKTYADFLDVFQKSKPIKEYAAKHDVKINFFSDMSDTYGTGISISDTSLNPNYSRVDVLHLSADVSDEYVSEFRFRLKSLIKQISELSDESLEQALSKLKKQAADEVERLRKLGKYKEDEDILLSACNERIKKSLDEIKNW